MVTYNKNWYSWLRYFWIFIPAFLYFRMVSHYAVNIPWSDDYDSTLGFLLNFKVASFGEKLRLLFSQHNEHRIFFSRIICLTYHAMFGPVNFRALTFIGNTQLLLTFFISVYFIKKCLPKYWSIVAFVWGLCLFDLNMYENAGVSQTSLANYSVVMMFFISLFFYSRAKKIYLIPAVIAQILCVYSSGNGILASLILAVYTLYTKDRLKAVCGTAVFLIFTPLYFVGYVSPYHEKVPLTIKGMVFFFMGMTGSHFSAPHGARVALLLIPAGILVFPLKKKEWAEPDILPVICILAFTFATICSAALFRSNVVDAVYYGSKYMIYPNLLAAIFFFLVFLKLRNSRALWPVMVVSTGIMLWTYSENYKAGRGNFALENHKLTTWNYYYPDTVKARLLTENACKAGIYCREVKQ